MWVRSRCKGSLPRPLLRPRPHPSWLATTQPPPASWRHPHGVRGFESRNASEAPRKPERGAGGAPGRRRLFMIRSIPNPPFRAKPKPSPHPVMVAFNPPVSGQRGTTAPDNRVKHPVCPTWPPAPVARPRDSPLNHRTTERRNHGEPASRAAGVPARSVCSVVPWFSGESYRPSHRPDTAEQPPARFAPPLPTPPPTRQCAARTKTEKTPCPTAPASHPSSPHDRPQVRLHLLRPRRRGPLQGFPQGLGRGRAPFRPEIP